MIHSPPTFKNSYWNKEYSLGTEKVTGKKYIFCASSLYPFLSSSRFLFLRFLSIRSFRVSSKWFMKWLTLWFCFKWIYWSLLWIQSRSAQLMSQSSSACVSFQCLLLNASKTQLTKFVLYVIIVLENKQRY